MKRGLRQGDPISPFLFLLVGEVLSRMLQNGRELGMFNGVKVGSANAVVSHLQFADDTIILCEPNLQHLVNIKDLLHTFQAISGLKVNYGKSGLLVLGKEEHWAAEARTILGCSELQIPIKYLGLPLGESMRKISAWQPVIETVQKRLASWKARTLSRAGRLVLIKSVLNSLPLYYLSLFKMPKTVAQKIIQMQRKFFWVGEKEGRYCALVSWDVIKRPKEMGGLGVGDLMVKNASLLFKWWWRFSEEKQSLWVQVVESIYKEDTRLLFPKRRNLKPFGPWKDIVQMGMQNTEEEAAFLSNAQFKIRDGRATSFWHDMWIGDKPLKSQFPPLFSLSIQQQEVVANMGWKDGGTWRWLLGWKRAPFLPEADLIRELEAILQGAPELEQGQDMIVWKPCSGGRYSVRTHSEAVIATGLELVQIDNVAAGVWRKLAPLKVEIMVWLAILGKLNTKDKLAARGMVQEVGSLCVFCSCEMETINHIFAHCHKVWQIWCSIMRSWKIQLVVPANFRELFLIWTEIPIKGKFMKKAWVSSFFAVTWSVWKARNDFIFNNKAIILEELIHCIKFRISCWFHFWQNSFFYAPSEVARCFEHLEKIAL